MNSSSKRSFRARRSVRIRLALVALLLTTATSAVSVASVTRAAQAQAPPTPARPLLLIGGTYAGRDHHTWPETKDYFKDSFGYDPEEGFVPDDPNRSDSLLVGELLRQDEEPDNWAERPDVFQPYTWENFETYLAAFGVTTAGLAPIRDTTQNRQDCVAGDSVELVRCTILFYALTTGSDIDVIAHSQAAPVARAAVKELVEQTGDAPVRTVIALGGASYGVSTAASSFQVGGLFNRAFLNDCRNKGWVPVCPDAVRREHPAEPYEWPDPARQEPIIPDGNAPSADLHHTDFFPWLNSLSGVGPLPGADAGITYYNLYSQVWDPVTRAIERHAPEAIPLFIDHPSMWGRNFCVQKLVSNLTGGQVTDHPVDHGAEWRDPHMRMLIAAALLGWTDPGLFCRQPT